MTLKKVPNNTTEYSPSLVELMNYLKDVYRFSGTHTKIFNKNSVKQHIKGLHDLVDYIIPEGAHESLRAEMKYRSSVHDGGEVLGELNILEDSVKKSGIRGATKSKYEFIIFRYFITLIYLSLNTKDVTKAFVKREINRYRKILSLCKRGKGSIQDLIKELNDKTIKTDYDDLNNMIDNFKHIEMPEEKDYKYYLFKALDLLEGNMYYVRNSSDKDKIPERLANKIITYSMGVCTKLKASTPNCYSLITKMVIAMMNETLDRYSKRIKKL